MTGNKEQEVILDTSQSLPTDKRPSNRRRIVKIVIIVVLLLFLVTGGATSTVLFNYINEAPPLDPSRLEANQTSFLYDINGDEITPLHGDQHRVMVSLKEVPEHVQQAFIAIEDERFYQHFGFDITGSIRAAYINLNVKIGDGVVDNITEAMASAIF